MWKLIGLIRQYYIVQCILEVFLYWDSQDSDFLHCLLRPKHVYFNVVLTSYYLTLLNCAYVCSIYIYIYIYMLPFVQGRNK